MKLGLLSVATILFLGDITTYVRVWLKAYLTENTIDMMSSFGTKKHNIEEQVCKNNDQCDYKQRIYHVQLYMKIPIQYKEYIMYNYIATIMIHHQWCDCGIVLSSPYGQ